MCEQPYLNSLQDGAQVNELRHRVGCRAGLDFLHGGATKELGVSPLPQHASSADDEATTPGTLRVGGVARAERNEGGGDCRCLSKS